MTEATNTTGTSVPSTSDIFRSFVDELKKPNAIIRTEEGDPGRGSSHSYGFDGTAAVLAEIERLQSALTTAQGRVKMLEDELSEAIEGWADGANYKGEYLKAKHGDEEGIAQARAVLQSSGAPLPPERT